MMTPGRKLNIDNLAVAEYPAAVARMNQRIHSWIHDKNVPYAEGCARQIIYGFKEDFETFPEKDGVTMYHGGEAYARLMDLVCGLTSQRTCETHVRNQFFDRWKKFAEKDPCVAKEYQTLISQIKKDSSLIMEKVLFAFKAHSNVHAARDLSNQKTGDNILIIGDVNDKGNMSGFTENLLKVCESKQKHARRGNFITVTHPDFNALAAIEKAVTGLEEKNVLRSGIGFAFFEDLPQLLETNDQVYVAMGMGENPEAEKYIIECWKNRLNKTGTLTCMKGRVEDMGLSTDLWKNAGLDQYISPEEVRAETAWRGETNDKVLALAGQATGQCAQLRAKGMVPRQVLTFENADLPAPAAA
jgi:hypothetical protein